MKRTLTEDERTTITNGLRVAAERFEGHVKVVREEGYHGLGDQFQKQAKDSRSLADLIDGCEEIEIAPFTCKGCGREESVCSANPCDAVIADREADVHG